MPTILLKKSDTPGSVPGTANLTNLAGGVEVAVNTADKRVYSMTSASAVIELGTNPSSLTCADVSATVLRSASATITNLIATSASITTLTNNPTFSAGTANGVLYLNASKVATSGSALVFDGTNLGIGTASPSTKLEVSGVGTFTAGMQVTWGSSGLAFGASRLMRQMEGTSIAREYICGADTSTYGTYEFYTAKSNGNATLAYSVNASGNVGIGTVSPAVKLHVEGSAGQIMRVTDGTTGASIYSGGGLFGFNNQTGEDGMFGSTASHFLYFATNGTERMHLDSSGNLGLGVTPSAWRAATRGFDVGAAGFVAANQTGVVSINVGSNAYLNSSDTWIYKTTAAATLYQTTLGEHRFYTAASGTINTAVSFTQAMTLDASGNLGVGTTSPVGRIDALDSIDGVSYFSLRNSSAGTSAVTRFRVGNSGSTNAFTLDVFGSNHATKANIVEINNQFNAALVFGTNGTERGRFTSGGLLQVNADSTSTTFTSPGQIALKRSNSLPFISWHADNGTRNGYLQINDASASTLSVEANQALTFQTNSAERGRFTAGGYFKASNNGTYDNSTGAYHEFDGNATTKVLLVNATNASFADDIAVLQAARNTTNNTFYALSYYNTGAAAYKFRVADSGDVTNTNGTYGTISDAKMKTDIADAGSQWDDMKAVRFRKFKMKDDPAGLVQLGVVAQELEQTSPGLVAEHADRDAEGNDLGTTTKSVKTSILLMKAAKALQEAMARIESLEAKVSALEAK